MKIRNLYAAAMFAVATGSCLNATSASAVQAAQEMLLTEEAATAALVAWATEQLEQGVPESEIVATLLSDVADASSSESDFYEQLVQSQEERSEARRTRRILIKAGVIVLGAAALTIGGILLYKKLKKDKAKPETPPVNDDDKKKKKEDTDGKKKPDALKPDGKKKEDSDALNDGNVSDADDTKSQQDGDDERMGNVSPSASEGGEHNDAAPRSPLVRDIRERMNSGMPMNAAVDAALNAVHDGGSAEDFVGGLFNQDDSHGVGSHEVGGPVVSGKSDDASRPGTPVQPTRTFRPGTPVGDALLAAEHVLTRKGSMKVAQEVGKGDRPIALELDQAVGRKPRNRDRKVTIAESVSQGDAGAAAGLAASSSATGEKHKDA